MEKYIAEFIGTALLILLGNGVVANVVLKETKGHGSGWIVITFGWGMAVFVAVWCVGHLSGAHINPAVTVGLAAAGRFAAEEIPGYLAGQMAGAICGASLVFLMYRDHYRKTENADAKLATFATAPAIRHRGNNFLSEVLGTFVLVFAVLMAQPHTISLGADTGEIGLGALGALPVGLLVLTIGLCLGGTTGYAINPARDLGPRIAHALLPVPGKRDSDWNYAWIPVAGPLVGGFVAAVLFRVLPGG